MVIRLREIHFNLIWNLPTSYQRLLEGSWTRDSMIGRFWFFARVEMMLNHHWHSCWKIFNSQSSKLKAIERNWRESLKSKYCIWSSPSVAHIRTFIYNKLKYFCLDFSLYFQKIRVSDDTLKSSIVKGLAFHHAGLSSDDREHVENAYRTGLIRILLSTNTLAMGVNLPAHTVIIKSTEVRFC